MATVGESKGIEIKQNNNFVVDMLNLETPEAADDVLWRACRPTSAVGAEGVCQVWRADKSLPPPGALHRRDGSIEGGGLEV